MQDDLIDAYVVCTCIKKKLLVEMVAKSFNTNNIKSWITQGYNKQLHVKKVTLLSESFYILNLCVLLVLRLFLVKYCFFNRLEETFKLFVNLLISPCQILPTAENRWRHCEQSTHMVAW